MEMFSQNNETEKKMQKNLYIQWRAFFIPVSCFLRFLFSTHSYVTLLPSRFACAYIQGT